MLLRRLHHGHPDPAGRAGLGRRQRDQRALLGTVGGGQLVAARQRAEPHDGLEQRPFRPRLQRGRVGVATEQAVQPLATGATHHHEQLGEPRGVVAVVPGAVLRHEMAAEHRGPGAHPAPAGDGEVKVRGPLRHVVLDEAAAPALSGDARLQVRAAVVGAEHHLLLGPVRVVHPDPHRPGGLVGLVGVRHHLVVAGQVLQLGRGHQPEHHRPPRVDPAPQPRQRLLPGSGGHAEVAPGGLVGRERPADELARAGRGEAVEEPLVDVVGQAAGTASVSSATAPPPAAGHSP